jgi:hypothetical protein
VSRPYVKVYRYRVRAEAVERCLEVWARAQRLNARHVPMTSVHLRSAEDPELWLELDTFPDEESYRRGIELVNADPEHEDVWRELEAALAAPAVEGEPYEELLRVP